MGNRTFCALAGTGIKALEYNVKIRGKGLEIRDRKAQPVHGTEKDLELTFGSRKIHIFETVKLGHIVADARDRDDTAASSNLSHIQVAFCGVQLPVPIRAELEKQSEITERRFRCFLVEKIVVHSK